MAGGAQQGGQKLRWRVRINDVKRVRETRDWWSVIGVFIPAHSCSAGPSQNAPRTNGRATEATAMAAAVEEVCLSFGMST